MTPAKTLLTATVGTLALIGVIVLVACAWLAWGGISARPAPGAIETALARRVRSYAIPREMRTRSNPVPASAEAIADGLEHFADHCALCHANDGSGQTDIGQGLYPRTPDMRRDDTQRLSDGELFYIIEHGVRLTGMPAWGNGTPESEAASWRLVHFIRHLPQLTKDELERMRNLNPRSLQQLREEEEERQFLDGDAEPPAPAAPHAHPGGRP